MKLPVHKFREDLFKLMDKHGIESLCAVFHDPDGGADCCVLAGETAWARGATALLSDLAVDQQLDTLGEPHHGPED